MDINEAEQKLKVSEEEVSAIGMYLVYGHTSINILADLDPKYFCKLSKDGWLLAENGEELKDKIKMFVDLYSAMYKETKEVNTRRDLIRGTSIKRARELNGTTKQFLSTSTDESIAKTFTEYGDGALLRISIGEGVPHIYSENYRDKDVGVNEKEVIIAPFCKVVENKLWSRWDGYEYYSVRIAKETLQEISSSQKEELTKKIIDGYEQNVNDMKEYVFLADRIENLHSRLQGERNLEEREYILLELHKTEENFYAVSKRTQEYKDNLNLLLQGSCREKEKEIDQAKEVIENARKETEVQKKEAERKEAITYLSQKIEGAVRKTGEINNNVLTTYNKMIELEGLYKKFAREFGVDLDSSVQNMVGESIENVTKLIVQKSEALQQTQVPETNSIKETEKQDQENFGRFESINESMQTSGTLPEVIDIFKEQSEDSIKRHIYIRMNDLMKAAKLNSLQQAKDDIQSQPVGLFDKITGKAKIRELQINNIDLRMKLEAKSVPEEKEHYSVRDMLAEIYMFSQNELGGAFTPELGGLFTKMQEKFRDTSGTRFSLDYIKSIAESKQEEHQTQNLPAIPKKGFGLFRRNREQIAILKARNTQLRTESDNVNQDNYITQLRRTSKKPAVDIFKEKLDDISNNLENDEPKNPFKYLDVNTEHAINM